MATAPRRQVAGLPRPLSRFVGRRREIEELRAIFVGTRLLTLTGPGGCGKTRLALELAAVLGDRFPDGSAFADLGAVRDGALVASAVAAALGLPSEAASATASRLGDLAFLLVVDNAEHVVEPVAWHVEHLLTACPGLGVLVTSRELLNIGGEVSWRVPSLSLPPPGDAPLEQLATYDAVELFCARAAEHEPGFRLTTENARLVADICRRLDGIPLALELAAARARSLPLAEIVTRLADSVRLLSGGSRTAIARHQTLRAALDWSHQLLEPQERTLFRRLALFVDTFDLGAAEAICASADLPREAVPDVLSRLVDKSLVATHPDAGGSLRYSLIEAIRQYGREQLVAAGETGLEAVHARHYGGLVERLAASDEVFERSQLLGVEYPNVGLALEWCSDFDAGLESRIIDGLRWFWRMRGDVREAHLRVLAALRNEGHSPRDQANLLAEAAVWSMRLADLVAANEYAAAAVAMLGQFDDPGLESRIYNMRGVMRAEAGDLDGAERDFVSGLDALAGVARADWLPDWANNLAMVRILQGRPEVALADAELAMDTMLRLGPSGRAPELFHTYGAVLLALGRAEEAAVQFVAGLEVAAANANYGSAVTLLNGLAAAVAPSDPALALTLVGAAESCRLAGTARPLHPDRAAVAAEQASRRALGLQRAAAAYEAGLALGLREAFDFAARAHRERNAGPAAQLTSRKREIVGMVAAGLSNKEIARRLAISERTVDAHLEQLRNQLGLRNRAQIATWAAEAGIPTPAGP